MAIPPNAKTLTRPMDPSDIVDFAIDLPQGSADTDFLQPGEGVGSFTLAVTAEAAAAGLQIDTTGGRATVVSGNRITFWLSVTSGQQSNSIFAGAGVQLGLELTVTTTASPPRVKQRTAVVQVANQ